MGHRDLIPTGAVNPKTVSAATVTTQSVGNAWRVGTVLEAIALGQSLHGRVKLQIGARLVTAQTSLPLVAGQRLRLKVSETGRTVVLRTTGDAPQVDPVREGIRQSLPRQAAQAPLMALAASVARSQAELPAGLRAAAAELANAIRDSDTFREAAGLRHAVRDSGLFLEKKLAIMSSPQREAVRSDWKAVLLRFRHRIAQLQTGLNNTDPDRVAPMPRNAGGNPPATAAVSGASQGALSAGTSTVVAAPLPKAATSAAEPRVAPASGQAVPNRNPATVAPPMRHALPAPQPALPSASFSADALSLVGDLLRHSDAALARVRLNQLASITPEQGTRLVWLLELPVRHADHRFEVLTLRIEHDEEGTGPEKSGSWTVDLAFDLGIKGVLRTRLGLRGGRIFGSFQADEARTRAELQDSLPALREAMEQKRLDVGCLSCGASAPDSAPIPGASLLETTA